MGTLNGPSHHTTEHRRTDYGRQCTDVNSATGRVKSGGMPLSERPLLQGHCQESEKAFARRTPLANKLRPDLRKQLGRMANFVVTPFRRCSRGPLQGRSDVFPGHRLQIQRRGQGIGTESLAVVTRKRFAVRDEPCLHCLHHEVNLALVGEPQLPAIALLKVGPGRVLQGIFGIDQKDHYFGFASFCSPPKRTKRIVSRPHAGELPSPASISGDLLQFAEECVHPLAQSGTPVVAVPASFHIDGDAGHGFAPSSPIRQRSPS